MEGLKWWRRARGLSQRELAMASGVGKRTIVSLEQGEVEEPRPQTLRKLAAGLGVDPIALLLGRQAAGAYLAGSSPTNGVAPDRYRTAIAPLRGGVPEDHDDGRRGMTELLEKRVGEIEAARSEELAWVEARIEATKKGIPILEQAVAGGEMRVRNARIPDPQKEPEEWTKWSKMGEAYFSVAYHEATEDLQVARGQLVALENARYSLLARDDLASLRVEISSELDKVAAELASMRARRREMAIAVLLGEHGLGEPVPEGRAHLRALDARIHEAARRVEELREAVAEIDARRGS
jgi:transcriptional regulator with XRE-family HTH domain